MNIGDCVALKADHLVPGVWPLGARVKHFSGHHGVVVALGGPLFESSVCVHFPAAQRLERRGTRPPCVYTYHESIELVSIHQLRKVSPLIALAKCADD